MYFTEGQETTPPFIMNKAFIANYFSGVIIVNIPVKIIN